MNNIMHFLVKASVFFMTGGVAAFFPAFWRNGPKPRRIIVENHYYEHRLDDV